MIPDGRGPALIRPMRGPRMLKLDDEGVFVPEVMPEPVAPTIQAIAQARAFRHFTRGDPGARVMVLCDPPKAEAWANELPMSMEGLKLVARHARAHGFEREDFCFLSLCPPMPESAEDSASRRWTHVETYAQSVWEFIEQCRPACLISFGDLATRVLASRAVAITKARGQPLRVQRPLAPDEHHTTQRQTFPLFPMLSPAFVNKVVDHLPTFISDWASFRRFEQGNFVVEQSRTDMDYEWCEDLTQLMELVARGEVVDIDVDTETDGVRWHDPRVQVLTVQLSYREGHAYVCPLDTEFWPEWRGRPRARARLIAQLKTLLEDPRITKAGHNLKFDVHMLRKLGIELAGWSDDTQLLAFAIDENMMEKSQEECVRRWVPELAAAKASLTDADKSNMRAVPRDKFLLYAGSDTDGVRRLKRVLKEMLAEDPGQERVYRRVQMPGIRAFAYSIERFGMLIDQQRLTDFGVEVESHLRDEYARLISQVPARVRLNHMQAYRDKARGRAKEHDGSEALKFSRADFVRDILFTRDGFNLKPVVFTGSTQRLPPDQRVPSTSSKDHLPFFADREDKAGTFVTGLIGYQKTEKLSGSFIGRQEDDNGLWQYIAPNGRVYPSYALHKTVTGRTACLTGDTLVTVLDPRGEVPIRDVRTGDWVWSFGDDLRPVPARVSWQGCTIRQAALVEVSYQTQGTRSVKTIRCTADHPFRLRDGSYVQASDLVHGHRVLALERGINHNGYRRLYATGGVTGLEHRIVAEASHGPIDPALDVHHGNEVKTDNRPTNLHPMTVEEHAKQHPWLPAKIAKREATRLRRRPAGRQVVNQPKRISFERTWAERVLRGAAGQPTVFRDTWGYDYPCALDALRRAGVDWRAIRAEFNARGELLADLLPAAREAVTVHEAARILGVNFYRAKELLASDQNHMILEVRHLEEREDVYDITVPGPHNFIANGVCVHNSSDPNGQNFPKRGKWAKPYQKIFRASPGFKMINCDLSQIELRIAAWMAMDPVMLEVYRTGGDIHLTTAMAVAGLNAEQWAALDRATRKKMRGDAKPVNFGFLYGMGAAKFRNFAKTDYNVDFTDRQSNEVRAKFFSTYSGLPRWHERMREDVRANGYVRALHGAVRHLPSINSNDRATVAGAERQAINSPVQRFGSDLGVMAMNRFVAQADPELFRMIGFVHDALVMEVRDGYEYEGMSALLWAMNNPRLEQWFGITAPLPILAEADIGLNNGELLEMAELPAVDKRPDWFNAMGWETCTPTKPEWWDDNAESEAPELAFAHLTA